MSSSNPTSASGTQDANGADAGTDAGFASNAGHRREPSAQQAAVEDVQDFGQLEVDVRHN